MVARAALAHRAGVMAGLGIPNGIAADNGTLPAMRPVRLPHPPAMSPSLVDADCERLLQVARLYWLVLRTAPDRPGLRHHADLLASGSTLTELATSLLALPGSDGHGGRNAARGLWTRAGGSRTGFEPAWQASSGLPGFVAELARRPVRRNDALLRSLFPGGVDPAGNDLGPAWGYRFWAAETDRALASLSRRAGRLLALFGAPVALTLRVDTATTAFLLDATLAGLLGQNYRRWRLVIEGATPSGWIPPRDARIVAGTVIGTAAGAIGDPGPRALQGTLRAGDVLAPDCLALFGFAALRRPFAVRWSCDEDRIDAHGLRSHPLLARGGGLLLHRGAKDQPGTTLHHLPAVLLHRQYDRRALLPVSVTARQGRDRGRDQGRDQSRDQPNHPSVSLVIATRDRPALLQRCLDSIGATTVADRPQIVVVDNGTVDAAALRILQQCVDDGGTVLRCPGPFNWSALCNAGVRASHGDVVVLMNNDVACIRPGWLESLVRTCADASVGVAGARLLYPDGRVQHAGVLVGPGPVAAHRLDGPDETADAEPSVAAVTGACMAFRREVFDRLGGLEEALPVTWNDLDFCLRARAAGLEVRLASGCVLQHDELGSRTPDTAPENRAQLERTLRFVAGRHGRALRRDRFSHPFLPVEAGGRLLCAGASSRIVGLLARGGID